MLKATQLASGRARILPQALNSETQTLNHFASFSLMPVERAIKIGSDPSSEPVFFDSSYHHEARREQSEIAKMVFKLLLHL